MRPPPHLAIFSIIYTISSGGQVNQLSMQASTIFMQLSQRASVQNTFYVTPRVSWAEVYQGWDVPVFSKISAFLPEKPEFCGSYKFIRNIPWELGRGLVTINGHQLEWFD